MYQLPPHVVAWIRAHHGVVTSRELDEFDAGRAARERLERTGVLCRIERGIFVLVGSPATLEQRCVIQCRAHPDGFITGPTAGTLAGLRRMPPTTGVHLSVRHGRRLPPLPGVVYHQTRALRADDRRDRGDGITVASWPRLAFDLAAQLRSRDHRSVTDQLLDRRLVTADELRAIGTRLCHPARPGSTTFALTIAGLDGARPHQSHDELRVADALRASGVPVVAQVPIIVPGRWTPHLDLGVPAVRWGVELDLHHEHRTLEGAARDAERRSIAIEADWTVETATELDVGRARFNALIERLTASYRRAVVRHRRAGCTDGSLPTLHCAPTLR